MNQTDLMLDNDELEIISQAAAKHGLSVEDYIAQASRKTLTETETQDEPINWS